jgi:hypothetical protein
MNCKKCGEEYVLSDEDTLHNLGVLEFLNGNPVLNNTGVLFKTGLFAIIPPIQCVRYRRVEKIEIVNKKKIII